MSRPLWLMIGVLTCVIAGVTFNRCLCSDPDTGGASAAEVAPPAFDPSERIDAAPAQPAPAEELPPVAPSTDEPAPLDNGYLSLTFDKLASYPYVYPDLEADEPPKDQIPQNIKDLDGKKIALQGFMLPVKTEGDSKVSQFLLIRNQMWCCFGVTPKMNEWLHVTMAEGKTATAALDIPVTVFGELAVGELWEDGVVMSLYRLEGEEVTEPPVFR